MARKHGRPPKTPSSSNKKTQEQQPHKEDENFRVDLSLSDEETLEEIDNLSPKKAEVLLRNLETLRARIEGKVQEKEKTDSIKKVQEEGDKRGSVQMNRVQEPIAVTKQPSVWDKKHVKKQWAEKKRPTKDDIEKIDGALRAKDEEALETAVAESNNDAVDCTPSKGTVVGVSQSESGEHDGGSNSNALNRGIEPNVDGNKGLVSSTT
ncbi:hypothetical protein RIF29_20870 [Crotalaria pallida]|uniref:Uncharacterized protein n=1 Tax=Crotalaria pallida TaxID=3830 RepID=A0AAN9I7W1_CROPI